MERNENDLLLPGALESLCELKEGCLVVCLELACFGGWMQI